MNGAKFDFRDHLAASGAANSPLDRRIVGISYNSTGVGIVAVDSAAARTNALRSYANVVIGPVAQDWQLIKDVIAVLPEAFSPISHDFTLRCTGRIASEDLRILRALCQAFPKARNVDSSVVAGWVERNALIIRMPDIPEGESWCAPLIRSAAETALYAGRSYSDGKP